MGRFWWLEDGVRDGREAGVVVVAQATCLLGQGAGKEGLAGFPGACLWEVLMAVTGLIASADISCSGWEGRGGGRGVNSLPPPA